jgi:hypothetical protein
VAVRKVTVTDEMRDGRFRRVWGEGDEESVEFGLAVGAEAGVDAVEVGVVVAGMGDELPSAFWHGCEQRGEGFGVEVAGGGDTDGAVGGANEAAAELL